MNPNQEIKFQDGRDFWFVHLDISKYAEADGKDAK